MTELIGERIYNTLQLGFAAFILIWNTIRLTSYAKREEIAIIKIVGDSSLYIRFPFSLEAIMESLLGAVVAVGLGVGLMNYISDSSYKQVNIIKDVEQKYFIRDEIDSLGGKIKSKMIKEEN